MTKVGDRVELIACSDPYTNIQPGMRGTVRFIDSMDTVHVTWDDGHSLGLVREAGDAWKPVEDSQSAKKVSA